jgi:hypothetical protein
VYGVDDGGPRAEEPRPVEQLDRRAAVLGAALVELARLLVGVDVADQTVALRVLGDPQEPRRADRSHAVRGDAHVDAVAIERPSAEGVDTLQEPLHRGVAEAPLASLQRPVAAVPAVAVVCGR